MTWVNCHQLEVRSEVGFEEIVVLAQVVMMRVSAVN